MDISVYIRPLLRWWWLIAAAIIVAAVSTFLTVLQQPDRYEAKTTLMIGRAINDPNPTQGEFYLAEQLAAAYADIVEQEPIREATKTALELGQLPEYLARAVPQSQFIEIFVTDTDPLRAQVVANELANQLILQSPTGAGSEDQLRRDFVSRQLDDLQLQILQTNDEITELQENLGLINSASELQDTQNQITALQQKLFTLQTTYATLLSNTQQGASNTLSIVDSADLPGYPVGPNKSLLILLAAGIGFILAAGAAYLLEYMDDTLKTTEEVSDELGLPVIGLIGDTKESDVSKNGVYVSQNPRSPVAESYRQIRSNLNFLSVDKSLRTIMVTSPNIDAGKSSVSANLASIIAQGGKSVILVDADLRRPTLHEYFHLKNDCGLAGLFLNGLSMDEAVKSPENELFQVITSGHSPPNPSELLSSNGMDHILRRLKELFDFIIVDSPPSIVPDTIDLGSKVDGVLLVIRPGLTRKKIAKTMLEQFSMSNSRMLGVVLNRVPQKELAEYGGYNYYSPYYAEGNDSEDVAKLDLKGYLQKYLGGIMTRLSRLRN